MPTVHNKLNAAFVLIASLFIAELILGFNGRLLLVAGIPVRMVTYGLFGVVLGLMILWAINRRQITLSWKDANSLWKMFEPFDYAFAAFILLNTVWIVVIPSISGYGIGMALEQTKSTMLLLLYFPLLILIKIRQVRLAAGDKIIKFCLFILALVHLFLYIGEKVLDNATFAIQFFETIERLTFGHSDRPKISYPMNYYRIIYPTSLFLLMVFYYTYKDKLTVRNMIFFLAGLAALLVTLTKSLWLGLAIGLAFIATYHAAYKIGRVNVRKITTIAVLGFACCCLMNATILDQYLFTRVKNAFAYNSSGEIREGKIVIEKGVNEHLRHLDELEGTRRANDTRIEQTKVLLNKWRQSPIFGFGYGSYAEELIRGPKGQPFLYEMLLPSLLVQIGLLGVLIWVCFFLYVFRYANRNPESSSGVLYLAVAICTASQFNPFILGAPAMSMFLYILLVIRTSTGARKRLSPASSEELKSA
ncbi:MAG: hypothetical protein C6W59_15265 [Paenibacillaceae bacterium]|nr:MAG: hypothetical protein C6W59_15265 [Paenibacillaceae bacterium]